MTQTSTVQFTCDTDTTFSAQCAKAAQNSTATGVTERVIGVKPNFENGYVTMNEEGLAIAMVPKQDA